MLSKDDFMLMEHNLSFFPYLTKQQQDLLYQNCTTIHFLKDQTIHYGDSNCIGVLFLKKGSIRIVITSEEGREITLYRLETYDTCILSASCILSRIDFDVTIEAEADCEMIQINSQIYAQLVKENIQVELFSYRLVTERFSDVMWAIQQLLFTSFDKRLGFFLLEESKKNPDSVIRMTHEQIAKYLGSAREVVTRTLKQFVSHGFVQLNRGEIILLDYRALHTYCYQKKGSNQTQ